ncbi:Ral guanine nucleotide dissociation stimulator [Vulpes lagopus]
MFSCCRPTSGGSGSQGCRLFQCCRLWLQHKNQGLRAFMRRRHQSSTRDMGREREEGVVCPITSRTWEVPCAANRGQRGLKGARTSAGKGPPICPTKPSRTELLEREFQQLLPALLRRDVISVFSFLDDYHGFATTEEVLDLLFTKYGCIAAACGGNDAVLQRWKLAICCILEIWMDYYREDFYQLPEFASLKKILEFIRQRMPGTDVELRARRYLQQLRRLHAAEPEAGATALARAKDHETLQVPAPAPTLGPAASVGPEVLEAVLAAGAEDLAPAEVPAGEANPLQIVVTALVHHYTLDEPPTPVATPEEEQAPAPAVGVPTVPELPLASGTTGFNP